MTSIGAGVDGEVAVVAEVVVFVVEGSGGAAGEGLGFAQDAAGFVVLAGDGGGGVGGAEQAAEAVVFHVAVGFAVGVAGAGEEVAGIRESATDNE